MKMALCHTFITLNSEYRLINTDQSLCFWWKRSHGDSEWWKETFCWCLSCFPQYFHFWLEVFSASVKEAGISSYRVDGKHLSRRYYLTMQDFLLCWNRFQTPWNSLLFQCHLPGIFCHRHSTCLWQSTVWQVYLGPFHPAYRAYCYGAFTIFQESETEFLMLVVSLANLDLNILALSCYNLCP